jgi:hypothetical protein
MPIRILSNYHFDRNIKNSCLNKLFEFLKKIGRIITYNFLQIDIIVSKYAYYKIVRSKHQYEYFTALILHKT